MAAVSLVVLPDTWTPGVAATFSLAIVCLSVVVITGYAGQLSLAQFVLAGFAALVAVDLSTTLPFVACLACAIASTAALGALVGVPALRTRGARPRHRYAGACVRPLRPSAEQQHVQWSYQWSARNAADIVWLADRPSQLSQSVHVCLRNRIHGRGDRRCQLAKGHAGRRLIAIRSNERAASALGISVYGVKIYAFSLAAGLAAIGGVMFGFLQFAVLPEQFTPSASLNVVVAAVVGGVGMVAGSVLAATLLPNNSGPGAQYQWIERLSPTRCRCVAAVRSSN